MDMISNRTKVTVGSQVFEIPTDKLSELLLTLSRWQSISVSENNGTSTQTWNGRSLILG